LKAILDDSDVDSNSDTDDSDNDDTDVEPDVVTGYARCSC